MKKCKDDERVCESCIGYVSCLTWMQKELKAKRSSCNGWYYANKEQVEAMLEYWENKTMGSLNFRVGDKVWSIQYGNGIITTTKSNFKQLPIEVKFKEITYAYTTQGKITRKDITRDLYHGHNLNIEVDEKLPIRKVDKWVFLYTDDTEQEVNVSKHFVTETACEAGMYRATYVLDFTVLSKPIKIQVLAKGTL